jgi:hypothetical protein
VAPRDVAQILRRLRRCGGGLDRAMGHATGLMAQREHTGARAHERGETRAPRTVLTIAKNLKAYHFAGPCQRRCRWRSASNTDRQLSATFSAGCSVAVHDGADGCGIAGRPTADNCCHRFTSENRCPDRRAFGLLRRAENGPMCDILVVARPAGLLGGVISEAELRLIRTTGAGFWSVGVGQGASPATGCECLTFRARH